MSVVLGSMLNVCEGFKSSSLRRIEIFRPEAHAEPLFDPAALPVGRYIAIVTDSATFSAPVPIISLAEPGWLATLATTVEREIMEAR